MYLLKILIDQPMIQLVLEKEGIEIGRLKWQDEKELSGKLLAAIDKLTRQAKIGISQLSDIRVESSQTSYTSTRIAQTVAKTVRYCLTTSKGCV